MRLIKKHVFQVLQVLFSKDTHGDLVIVCVFNADAAVPAVVISTPEVKIRHVGGGRWDFTGVLSATGWIENAI